MKNLQNLTILKKIKPKAYLYVAWIQAIVAVFGSLFFSEIKHFAPCSLCWYQRIFMYPLVLMIPVGIIKKDKNLPYYVLPLVVFGIAIAIIQNLLYWNVISETYIPCSSGVSCTTKFIQWFGFVTIPFLSLMSFLLIAICMVIYLKLVRKNG